MHYVDIPHANNLMELYVTCTLRQCGVSKGDVEAFLKDSRA